MTNTRYATTSTDLAISIMKMADHHGARVVAESTEKGTLLLTITTHNDVPVSTHPAPGGTINIGGGGTWVLTGNVPEWIPPVELPRPWPAPAPVKPTHRWGFINWDADSNCTHDRATVQHGQMDDFWHCPDCGGETDA
jgi:hypothetical protein